MAPRPTKAQRAEKREATTSLQLRPKVSQSLSAPTPPASLASDNESDDVSMGSDDVSMGSDDVSMGSDDVSMGSDDVSMGSGDVSMGSDDDSVGSDYVRVDYVRRKPIVENVEAYSAQFEKCGVSFFKEKQFYSKMRKFRHAPKQTRRLRDGSEPKLRLMVKDFDAQFGSMFWPGESGVESDVETDKGDVDSDEEMEMEDEDGDEQMDEEDDGTWIAEAVYEYFDQMQRLRYKEK